MAAGCGLSTRGHWDGSGMCTNEWEGGSARNAAQRKVPCERAAAAVSPFSDSVRDDTPICQVSVFLTFNGWTSFV
jgi:hypothetical protein